MADDHPERPEDEAASITLSAVRRERALAAVARVAAGYGDQVAVAALPDDAADAPVCELRDVYGAHLATVRSNAEGTSLLIGPGQVEVQVEDGLDDAGRFAMLEAILRGALDQQLGAS